MSTSLQHAAHLPLRQRVPLFRRIPHPMRVVRGVARRGIRLFTRAIQFTQREMYNTINAQLHHLNVMQQQHAASLLRHAAVLEELDVGLEGHKATTDQQQESLDALLDSPPNSQADTWQLDVERLRAELAQQQRKIQQLVEETHAPAADRPASWRGPDPATQAPIRPPGLDALYAALADRTHGSREAVKARRRVYVPLVREASLGTTAMPVLDLGCGRGEWLETLRDHGLVGRGTDDNSVFVYCCQALGLEVSAAGGLDHLRALPTASVGAVTLFNAIEHLPFEAVVALTDEIIRVLKPGGLGLFEMSSAKVSEIMPGLCVGVAPWRNVSASTLQFLAEQRGLQRATLWSVDAHGLERLDGRSTDKLGDRAVLAWKA